MPSQTAIALRSLMSRITPIALALLSPAAAAAAFAQDASDIEVPAGTPVAFRLARAAIVHSFSGELVDSAGKPIAGPVAWAVTVGTGRFSAMTRLTSARAALRIPRPFGVRIDLGDSLVISAEITGVVGARVRMRVGYDLAESATTRIAVRAAAAVADERETSEVTGELGREAIAAWTWTAEADGHLVAINAPQLAGAASVVIEDAATGRVIWRQSAPSRFAGAATQLDETLRPGIIIDHGRTYRLRIERGTWDSVVSGAPVIMLVPRANVAR